MVPKGKKWNPKWILTVPVLIFLIGMVFDRDDISVVCCIGLASLAWFLAEARTTGLCIEPDLFDWRTAVDLVENLYRNGKDHGDHRTPPGLLRKYAETMRMIEAIEEQPEKIHDIVAVEWSGYSSAQKKKRKYLMDGEDDAENWLEFLYRKRERLFPPLLKSLGEFHDFCGKNAGKRLPPTPTTADTTNLPVSEDPDRFCPKVFDCDNCREEVLVRPDTTVYIVDVRKGRTETRYQFCCPGCRDEWLSQENRVLGWDSFAERIEWYNSQTQRYGAREVRYERQGGKMVRVSGRPD